ncbi:hypothetical protein LTR35_005334 [Friedmanniomyces endolithicus]|uniref:Elongation of fatty acids protein n=1 Tax=Friedmanniomyces endolithicus TaxID=329885 RepID=A0AAN6G0Y1_9PEZI|nr:hypothetical protein LTR35_005334 [Friedmanniomyces endolithicus]KAK0299464.1 hypothetical protein LTS00_001907 [Friedmanniomyces endolithicus]KAK0326958.1 hypothetical protein LTR82_001718 [Friedmanniomyces endolithicus]KAK1019207.1 hypothetical protein LTR54_001022 [Friedmanniomyces endolithicus]
MSGPSVYLSWPTAFHPFPDPLPAALPPPIKERTFRSPFGIDKDLFNFALEPWLPFTVAAVYIVTVFLLNAYNRNRGHKPWWLARQRPFQWFVVVHNIMLAIFSAATFLAMVRAIVHTWPEISGNPHPAASIADALCKINGPRGLGDATTYNATINIWEVKNSVIHLGYDGNPDPTDVGRLWNEGLAFWGWVFYVSKFYEVLDTLIILAKGKRSATLQTYHHAGAMLCMWAGIRYMSPPIWMFVFINSAIHAMMYTYFTFSALGYKVPQGLKRILTSLQIAQFVFGASYAAVHLFVAYDIPLQTSYQVASIVERAASSASSVAVAATSSVSSVIATPTPRDWAAWTKKMLLRAAGEEGLAERVRDRYHHLASEEIEKKIEHFNEQTFETHWRTEWTKVQCIDTTGQAFAIYLNLLYLAPLTGLFLRFFVRAYTQRGQPKRVSEAPKQIADSSKQAEEETEQYVERNGERLEDEIAKRGRDMGNEIRQDAHNLHEQLREDVQQMKEGKFRGSRRVSDRVASFEGKAKDTLEKGKEQSGNAVERTKEQGRDTTRGSESPRSERSGSPQKGGSGSPRKNRESAIEEDDAEEQPPQQGSSVEKGNDDATQPERKMDEATSQPEQPKPSRDQSKDESKPGEASRGDQTQSSAPGQPEPAKDSASDTKSTGNQDSPPSSDKTQASTSSQPEQPKKSSDEGKAEEKKDGPSGGDKAQPSAPSQAEPSRGDKSQSSEPSQSEPAKKISDESKAETKKDEPPRSEKGQSSTPSQPEQPKKPSDEVKAENKKAEPPRGEKGQSNQTDPAKKSTDDSKAESKKDEPPRGEKGPSSPTKPRQPAPRKIGQTSPSKLRQPSPSKKGPATPSNKGQESREKTGQPSQSNVNEKPGEKASVTGAGDKSQSGNGSGEPPAKAGANNETEEKQDANMETSQALRPGTDHEEQGSTDKKATKEQGSTDKKATEEPKEEQDSDAMGQSGSIIDMAMEKANDARKEAESGGKEEKEEDPTAGAEPSGQQWRPPGVGDTS